MSVWRKIGQQLQHPQGLVGKLVGHAMRIVNTKPNSLAIAALAIEPTDHILELGFGPGQAIAQMAQRTPCAKIYGIDASSAMVAQAKWRNRRSIASGKITLTLGDFFPIAMEDASLDKILAVNVVYFWKDAAAVLAECYRVLSPGGKISIYATDASTMQRWKFAGNDTHIHYTAENLHVALLQAGFAEKDTSIETMMLPTGIKGILAVGRKSMATV